MRKVAISQSNYIPWKGYFDSIALVDEFVLYDDMQYTKRDWRNRNKVKTPSGLKWLTIPVEVKGKFYQKINETKISDKEWNNNHLNSLKGAYSKSKCYKEVLPFIEELYKTATQETISEVNYHFITKICNYLEIKTKITFSSHYKLLDEGKTEKLVDLCDQLGATEYFSGPAAKNYMEESLFSKKNIKVSYYDYSNYSEYEQINGDFEHGVTILDLIFNEGKEASKYLKMLK
jgi:uncharacterized protein YozE (UPF0346 family)